MLGVRVRVRLSGKARVKFRVKERIRVRAKPLRLILNPQAPCYA